MQTKVGVGSNYIKVPCYLTGLVVPQQQLSCCCGSQHCCWDQARTFVHVHKEFVGAITYDVVGGRDLIGIV